MLLAGKCDRCAEVEQRLTAYLRRGGVQALKFLAKALEDAGYRDVTVTGVR